MNTSSIAHLAFAVVVSLAAAGCENLEKMGVKVERKPAEAGSPAAGPGLKPATAAAGVPNPIPGTELDGLFRKNPISNSRNPETWPRVAITIKSGTAGVFALKGAGTLRPDDCVVFDVRLWKSASDGRSFENLRLCTDAVAKASTGVAFRTLQLMPRFTFHKGANTTAARRTEGPVPPFHMFPQDIKSQQAWVVTNQNTLFFLGAILLSMGYDWDNDFDRRLWVVSVPTAAG